MLITETGCGPVSAQGEWVLSALHPDPTPPFGAPDAEFVAMTLFAAEDSCASLEGWTLSWNGNERVLGGGCWTEGTVVVVHRASDSTDFTLVEEVPMPLSSWPALLNSGGTVVLADPEGRIQDAMVYTEDGLGGGGRPLLRADPAACGAPGNQALWLPGDSPFRAAAVPGTYHGPSGEAWRASARSPDRLVPRGPGVLDWFLGEGLDPVAILTARAWMEGEPAALSWLSDSVARVEWTVRLPSTGGGAEDALNVALGPLKTCGLDQGQGARLLMASVRRAVWGAKVEVVGVLPDPVPGDPSQPEEAFALMNPSSVPVDLGPWEFGGARLTRRVILDPDTPVWLEAHDFDDWPGLPNEGGRIPIRWPHGDSGMAVEWSRCDHDLPGHVGTGVGLVRSPGSGGDWRTAGFEDVQFDAPRIVGHGCPPSAGGPGTGLPIHLNRHAGLWPGDRWELVDREVEVRHAESEEGTRTLSIEWEGMAEDLHSKPGVEIRSRSGEVELDRLRLRCPDASSTDAPPCIRVVELMWNARADGAEYAELENCGSAPVELAGLQATTASDPFPSDWDTWVDAGRSLVLPPGGVMAFGACAKWMGRDLTSRGPHRWNCEEWSPLHDGAGSLAIRLPALLPEELDRVEWTGEEKGPWWWTEDGWAWIRSGLGASDWSPAADRGSPGRRQVQGGADCHGAVQVVEAGSNGWPMLVWSFPEAGGVIVIRMVDWPGGMLRETKVLEDILPEGSWTWSGMDGGLDSPYPGPVIWEVQWWSGTCRGRRRMALRMPGHG